MSVSIPRPKEEQSKPRATLFLAPNKILHGKSQYLGGEQANNGKIYCIPGHSSQVLVIDPTTSPETLYTIGPKFEGEYKWLRGLRAPNGILYGLPCHADSVMRIDPLADTVTTIPRNIDKKGLFVPWKYHGGTLCPIDECIYAIPQSAPYVLKVNPRTDEVSYVGKELPGKYKWLVIAQVSSHFHHAGCGVA